MLPSTSWNPTQCLGLSTYLSETEHKCIYHIPKKDRRCGYFVKAPQWKDAKILLSQLSAMDLCPTTDQTLERKLQEVASCLLCKRWHPKETSTVAKGWLEKVKDVRTETEAIRDQGRGQRTQETRLWLLVSGRCEVLASELRQR